MESEHYSRVLNRLLAGADSYGCGPYLLGLTPLQRGEIFTSLAYDRLARKLKRVEEIFTEADQNWNQTCYLMFFRTLGDKRNQEAYLTLARKVNYATILRERASLQNVEALLFGCSGLLELYEHDIYTLDLRRDFEYLSAKYNITPMDPSEWDLNRINPTNHPVLRIAQAAALFSGRDFVMNQMVACHTLSDVQNLFGVEASGYWCTHHLPAVGSVETPKRIGSFKANILGINLVAIMQYAYGSSTGSDQLRDCALTLLERLPAEDNVYMRGWRAEGLTPINAFESQALLQLTTEFCTHHRCEECPVGGRRLSL